MVRQGGRMERHAWVLTLQDLEVLNVGIFRIDVKLDARHGNVLKNAVKDLTKSSTASFHRFH